MTRRAVVDRSKWQRYGEVARDKWYEVGERELWGERKIERKRGRKKKKSYRQPVIDAQTCGSQWR